MSKICKTKNLPGRLQDLLADLPEGWLRRLDGELNKPYFVRLNDFLGLKLKSKKTIYPRPEQWFSALRAVSFDDVRVVILGQDPYHGVGQANGLCFSVGEGVKIPPSLVNIFKELKSDFGIESTTSGSLMGWAKQGVLLLNSVLTVDEGMAGSHQGRGWETFTDQIVRHLAEDRDGLVFVLWGAYAQKKGAFIDRTRHLVLESVHPSPLSAYRGFFGSKPFSTINNYLLSRSQSPIAW
jgi:uracil-DNA glycosylase